MDDYKKILRPVILSFIVYILGLIYIERHETMLLLPWFLFLFAEFLVIYLKCEHESQIKFAVFSSVVFRAIFFFSLPVLSDDFYRFIWDGLLLNAGMNPFVLTPVEIMQEGLPIHGITEELYSNLNSKPYHSIYPPINQMVFFIATFIFPKSIAGGVFVIRLVLFAAEVGSLILLFKLAKVYKFPRKNILFYALNPLVILEVTGNLHFEGLMIFFLLFSIYLLKRSGIQKSALLFGLAISTKLIPVIGWALLLKRIKLKRSFHFILISGGITFFLFIGFFSKPFLEGISSSIGLYFQKFEFNASLYYIIREIGFYVRGYNVIKTAGIWLALITFSSIIIYAAIEYYKKVNFPTALMVIWTIYLLFSTTVHPWYILPLVAFSLFGRYRYPLAWSLLIFFTYANYQLNEYHEIIWIVIAEYSILAIFIYREVTKHEFSLESKLAKK